MKYYTRLRVRRVYEWRGQPIGFNRKLKTHEYGGMSIRVEGLPKVTKISVGQHILIEGDDEDNPYVAKVLRLFGDEEGKQKKAVVQWFVRVSEVPLNKLKLLGREPHPQEIFYYEGHNCDDEVNAESILRPVQVVHVDSSAPFPSCSDRDALFVKLSWDSRSFQILPASAPSLPLSPPCSPPTAALNPAPRRLPTPNPAIMRKALSALTPGTGPHPQEAESLHSATKLSASKYLSAKRRGSASGTPGVRKKLQLHSLDDSDLVLSDLDQLLSEDLETDGVLAQTLSPPLPLPSLTPRRRRAPVAMETNRVVARETAAISLKPSSVVVSRMSLPQDHSPSSLRWCSPDPADSLEAELPESNMKTPQRKRSSTPRRNYATRGQKVTTPSRKREVNKMRRPALAVLAEDSLTLPTATTPRTSKRRSAQLVSSRIRKQLTLLSGHMDLDSDLEEEEFVPSKKELNSSSDEEEEQAVDSEEEELVMKRGRKGSAPTPKSKKTLAHTPRKTLRKVTPSSPRTPRTPRHATPSIPCRSRPAKQPANSLEEARARLHVSSVPESLPCREQEFQDIYSFVESKVVDGTGGCMYISGVPGTGKTATVHEVLRCLQVAAENGEIPVFTFIEINGMKMTDPHQAYIQILQRLTGQKATADHAASLLEKRFSSPAPRKETTVLLVDELDLLWTRKQNVMYNLFEWPTRRHARLVVLTIANTMDLPERIMINRVASRLGLTRMSFQPYSFKQLQQIISSRLNKIKAFEEDALQLVSRKVAALSGDARRCLDICRRATEICEHSDDRSESGLVGMSHVMEALNEMFSSAYVTAIRSASLQEQLFLRAVIAEFRRLGLEEATFQQVFVQQVALCRVEGLPPVSVSEALSVCQRLGACRLLLLEPSRLDIHLRVRLNVSQDDVLFALRDE